MKKQKFNQKRVYACPECWFRCKMLMNQKNPGQARKKWPVYLWTCDNDNCKKDYLFKDTVCFDSQAEAAAGLKFKEMEHQGKISELKHHVNFELWPPVWLMDEKIAKRTMKKTVIFTGQEFLISYANWSQFSKKKREKMGAILEIHKGLTYQSDFWYFQDLKPKIVEIKELNKSTGLPYFAGDSKNRETNERQFAHICQLMKVIHGLDVDIYAGGIWWRWDEDFKKLEVMKNGI